ncbi:MAG: hypothetical protein LBF40_09875 [Deltaproteobacteria bacterium]|jgi:hypothetical protein|nr:hypothetical protein [Deltaproteobacteria bacterium]
MLNASKPAYRPLFGSCDDAHSKKFMDSHMNDWPVVIREQVFPNLPVRELEHLCCKSNGRITHSLCTLVGLMIIQQYFDFTDHITLKFLKHDTKANYALRIDCVRNDTVSGCRRAWVKFRRKVINKHMLSGMVAKYV